MLQNIQARMQSEIVAEMCSTGNSKYIDYT